MDHLINIKKGDGFVHSYFRGPITLERLAELITKTARIAKEWGSEKYLADFRDAGKRQINFTDDYDLAYRKVKEYGFKPGSKHALLIRRDEEIDQWGFVETVFQNAGFTLRIFTEEEVALDWIRK